jgi:lactoylglutathione lyase
MVNATLKLVVLKTHQVDNLRSFYSAIGVELVKEQHGNGPIHFAGHVGDVVFEVYPLPEDGPPADATMRLGFAVAGVVEVVQALQALGSTVVTQPQATQWGFRAVVRDPDGRAVEISQR